MSTKIDFVLELLNGSAEAVRLDVGTAGRTVDSRVWTRVPLHPGEGGRVWNGDLEVKDLPSGTLFDVRFTAPVGTQWRFRAAKENAGTLYETGEIHTTRKDLEELIGRLS